jgi:type IV secretion system protein VirD4
LLLALDEAANFARIPRLAGYASSGPGQGIQLLLCFHDLAQIEAGYGREEARTIWNNCRARLLLPGQGDLVTLEHFSRAIGDETRTYSVRHGNDRSSSSSEQRTGRPLSSPDDLRRLGEAVLVYASAPPARLQLRRWDQVRHFRRLAEGGGPAGRSQRRPSLAPSALVGCIRGKGGSW